MPTVEVTIINRLGLHARAAAKLVQAASRYCSQISVERDDKTVNGKSIMGVMMLAASQGTTLKISATGDDADVALSEIVGLVNSRFGEPS
tara:strand:- start:209 stop:478 length:270 start_codon:yes stop_codon:yes gene_type:complete